MEMHHIRRGAGKPLVLIHGLGGSLHEWAPVLDLMAAEREVIVPDLPGFGGTPPLSGESSIATLADAICSFLVAQKLEGADVAGVSMGGRLVLELARRGVIGAAVALDPGGFWRGWERAYFFVTIGISVRLVRLLQPLMPLITATAVGRSLLFAQLSARPWRIAPRLALAEMRSFAVSSVFDELLRRLARGPMQEGTAANHKPIVIGWGRNDRLCIPRQAARAMERFPHARLHWFAQSGHFPQWDQPAETARLILDATGDGASVR